MATETKMAETKTTPERQEAIHIANKILDDSTLDPDSTLSVLSRQFLRANECIIALRDALEHYTAVVSSVNDPTDFTSKIKDEGHYARDALTKWSMYVGY